MRSVNEGKSQFSLRSIVKKLPYKAILLFLLCLVAATYYVLSLLSEVLLNNKTNMQEPEQYVVSSEFEYSGDEEILAGDVVATDDNGMITKKTGTTIYKNEHKFRNKVMLNLHAVALDESTFVSVYQGGLVFVRLNSKDKVAVEFQVKL